MNPTEEIAHSTNIEINPFDEKAATVSRQPEHNYCITRRKLPTVRRARRHSHPYLYGQPFLLRTDHAPPELAPQPPRARGSAGPVAQDSPRTPGWLTPR